MTTLDYSEEDEDFLEEDDYLEEDEAPRSRLAFLMVDVRLWVALALAAAGFAFGYAIASMDNNAPATTTPTTTNQGETDPGQLGPALTEEQLQGQLPAGHPDISSGQGGNAKGGTRAKSDKGGK